MAQRRDSNQPQSDDQDEYVEMDPVPPIGDSNDGIYFSPCDINPQNPPADSSNPVQNTTGGIYDLPGSSDVYKIKSIRRSLRSQKKKVESRKNDDKNTTWSMATKLHVSLTLIVLLISVSALGTTLFGILRGRLFY